MENTNEFQTGESGGFSFDPIVLLVDLAKRWLIILLAAVTVGVGAYIVKDATYISGWPWQGLASGPWWDSRSFIILH